MPDTTYQQYNPNPPAKMSPVKRKAVLQRFAKVSAYTIIGIVLSGAGYLAFSFFTDAQLPSWVVTMATITISGAAASVHKSINWVEVGVEPPEMSVPTVPPMTIPSFTLPGPGSETPGETP